MQPFVGFVYRGVRLVTARGAHRNRSAVQVEHRAESRPRCGHCEALCPGYDRLEERRWMFVPLWGLATEYVYTPRPAGQEAHRGGRNPLLARIVTGGVKCSHPEWVGWSCKKC